MDPERPGTFRTMSTRPVLEGTVTRAEAARILGVGQQRVTRLLAAGKLQRRTGRLDGRCWRHEVEALATARAERRRETEELLPRPSPILPMDRRHRRRAHILGVSAQYVGRLAAQGRLPWLPTGRTGGQPTRVYRRTQIKVIARARRRD